MGDADKDLELDILSTITNPDHQDDDLEPNPGDVPQPEDVPESEEQKQLKRFEYHQSRADKAEAEAKRLSFAAPIAKILEETPELAIDIQAALEKRRGEKRDQGPKRPEPPVKPTGYDPVAAFQNPESESWKYRESLDEYRDNYNRYNEEMGRAREAQIQAELQKRAALEQERIKIAQLRTHLASSGMSQIEQDEFLQFVADPNELNVDNLRLLFKIKKAKGAQKPPVTDKTRPPVPPIGGGGAPRVEPEDVSTQFSKSFLKPKGK